VSARAFAACALLAALAGLAIPAFGRAAAQTGAVRSEGDGVIRLVRGFESRGVLSPLTCNSRACRAVHDLLYPRLFAVDARGAVVFDGENASGAVVLAEPVADALPADTLTVRIRRDQAWSDGTPVTAYDVLYTLLTLGSPAAPDPYYVTALAELAAIRLDDAYTLTLFFDRAQALADEPSFEALSTWAERVGVRPVATPDYPPGWPTPQPQAAPQTAFTPTATCDDLARVNVPILPAHAVFADFGGFADTLTGLVLEPADWRALYDGADLPGWFTNIPTYASIAYADGPITSGRYRWVEETARGTYRFAPVNGEGPLLEWAVLDAPLQPDRTRTTDGYLTGAFDVALSTDAVTVQTLDGLAADTVAYDVAAPQQAVLPGDWPLVVRLNRANPLRPLPAVHPETGAVLDQGVHPLLDDPAVRDALRHTLDRARLIEDGYGGLAQPLYGLFPPASWAASADAAPDAAAFANPAVNTGLNQRQRLSEARRILEAGGWSWDGAIGTMRCTACALAEPGTPLILTVVLSATVTEADQRAFAPIVRDWRSIGIQVTDTGQNVYTQAFDMALERLAVDYRAYADPDPSLLITAEGDRLDVAEPHLYNTGSYRNPEAARLVAEARTVPGCAVEARAALYARLDAVLADDPAFLPLLTPYRIDTAGEDVLGFTDERADDRARTRSPLAALDRWRPAR
jgi:ABC-type transport system substrate-binding protein